MNKRKPMPTLAPFLLFPGQAMRPPRVLECTHDEWVVIVADYFGREDMGKGRLLLRTPYYKTERGARNCWNKMMSDILPKYAVLG